MKKKQLIFLFLITFVGLTLTGFGQIKEVIKVSGTFMDFNKAVEKKDDVAAQKYVGETTIKYFDLILNYVKAFDTAANDSAFLANRNFIILLHQNLSADQYKTLNATDFFSMVIKSGLFLKLDIGRFHPGEINMNGESATVSLTTFSTDEKTKCLFSKEKKGWKIDLSSVIPYLSSTLPN